MNDILIHKTTDFFQQTFGSEPSKTVLSPGRINIIGEHIDYNDGYVLPAAIDKIICFAFEKNNSDTAKIVAIDLNDEFEVCVNDDQKQTDSVWTNDLRGVLNQLKMNGYFVEGFNQVGPHGGVVFDEVSNECLHGSPV